jgi:hypothetical protein
MESSDLHEPDKSTEQTAERVMRRQVVWPNAVGLLFLHLTAVYGLYVLVASAKLLTWLYSKLKTYSLLICIF